MGTYIIVYYIYMIYLLYYTRNRSSACTRVCECVYVACVGSRPGPLVLSMNFIDGGGSTIRVVYA